MMKKLPPRITKPASWSSYWVAIAGIVWITVVLLIVTVAIFMWRIHHSDQATQVRQLRHELDSISQRGYQVRFEIDNLTRISQPGISWQDSFSVDKPYLVAPPPITVIDIELSK